MTDPIGASASFYETAAAFVAARWSTVGGRQDTAPSFSPIGDRTLHDLTQAAAFYEIRTRLVG